MTHSITNIKGEELWLLKEKAIYWPRKETIIVADLHFGKVSHFRKSGIAIPQKAILANWRAFSHLLTIFPTKRVIILGDLFHSEINSEWDQFTNLLDQFEGIQFDLVIGNHDIIGPEVFSASGLYVHDVFLKEAPFLFVHDEKDIQKSKKYYALCGHLHPGIKISAPGMRSLTLPCYHFNAVRGVLPAFGKFTGFCSIDPKPNDQFHVISDKKVLKWK